MHPLWYTHGWFCLNKIPSVLFMDKYLYSSIFPMHSFTSNTWQIQSLWINPCTLVSPECEVDAIPEWQSSNDQLVKSLLGSGGEPPLKSRFLFFPSVPVKLMFLSRYSHGDVCTYILYVCVSQGHHVLSLGVSASEMLWNSWITLTCGINPDWEIVALFYTPTLVFVDNLKVMGVCICNCMCGKPTRTILFWLERCEDGSICFLAFVSHTPSTVPLFIMRKLNWTYE